jgi:hypothetical protein
MAMIRSTWLVDYYFLVVCTNRLIRRFLDWNDGQYDFRPISSLTPMVIALLMLSVAIINYQAISRENRKFGAVLIAVLILGCLLGIPNGLGMIYSFLDYLTPLAVLAYALWLCWLVALPLMLGGSGWKCRLGMPSGSSKAGCGRRWVWCKVTAPPHSARWKVVGLLRGSWQRLPFH